MKKKLLLKTMLLLCALVAGSSSVWADDYVLYSGTITEGDYVVVYDGGALKNTVSSYNRFDYMEVTIANDKISNPGTSIVWHIAASGDYWTLYNETVSKYAASTGSKNQGALSETLNDNAKWIVTGSSTYDFENLARKNSNNDPNNKWLRKNGTFGFACYASGTGGALSLYKKQESSGEATTVTIDDSDITNTDIAAGTAAGSLSAVVKNSSSVAIPSATVTWSSSKPAVATIDATTGVVTLVKKGSTTITASYAGVENTYLSSNDTYVLNVTNSAANDGSSDKPFTIVEARDALDAAELVENADYYVKGIISKIDSYDNTNKAITYWISDDGTTANQLECYKGKGLNGADFSAKEDLELGDIVIVKGKLTIYNSTTYEFTSGNEIATMTQRTKVNLETLTFDPTSLVLGSVTTATATATLDVPACTTATLTYESLDGDIATCTSAGVITAVAKGGARIKVTLSVPATDPNYKLGTVKTKMETITVANPSHTATFSVNGVTTEESFEEGEDITFPADPAAIDGKIFVGWITGTIDGTTNDEPEFVESPKMGDAGVTYYAVFATSATDSGTLNYTLDYSNETSLASSTNWGSYGKAFVYTASDGGTWTVKAYKNAGMQLNTTKNCSIKVPECSGNIQSIEITCSAAKAVGFSASDYTGSETITYLAQGTDATSQTLDLSNSSVTTGYIVPKGGSTSITKIVVNYLSEVVVYSGYCTTVSSVTANVAASGYTTFACSAPLDFANATDASDNKTLKAYVVSSVTNTEVTLTEVTSVPANTGVVLKGNASTAYTIPVIASADDIDTNLLTAVVTATTVAYESVYVVSGGKFCLYQGTEIPAGKAYLPVSAVPAGASMLNLDFGGATGVDNVRSQMKDFSGDFYNMNGQRVAQPTKGLYIVNGKKVIVK